MTRLVVIAPIQPSFIGDAVLMKCGVNDKWYLFDRSSGGSYGVLPISIADCRLYLNEIYWTDLRWCWGAEPFFMHNTLKWSTRQGYCTSFALPGRCTTPTLVGTLPSHSSTRMGLAGKVCNMRNRFAISFSITRRGLQCKQENREAYQKENNLVPIFNLLGNINSKT